MNASPDPARPARAAVIGTGAMGRTHLRAYRDLPGVEICGVVSRSAEPGDVGAEVFRDVGALLAGGAPDVVSVCTPTPEHAAAVTALVEAGVDVVCEKPLDLDLDVARDLVAAAQCRGVHLFVAHVVRYFGQYAHVAALAAGGLGGLRSGRLWRAVPQPPSAGGWMRDEHRSGGVAVDLLIHDVDAAVGMFGRPDLVRAERADLPDGGVAVRADLTFPGGAVVAVEGSWGGVDALTYGLEVTGTDGAAAFDGGAPDHVRVTTAAGAREVRVGTDDPYAAQLRAYLAARGRPPVRDERMLTALEVSLAMRDAARSREPVALGPAQAS